MDISSFIGTASWKYKSDKENPQKKIDGVIAIIMHLIGLLDAEMIPVNLFMMTED